MPTWRERLTPGPLALPAGVGSLGRREGDAPGVATGVMWERLWGDLRSGWWVECAAQALLQ